MTTITTNTIPAPQPLKPPPGPMPQPAAPVPDIEIKKSPFRFLLPLLVVVLILGVGGFVASRFLNRSPSSSAPTELVYWGLWEPNNVLQSVFQEFEAQNPGVKINYQQQKSQDYRERLQTALTNNQGPDLFRYHQTWLPMLGSLMAPVPKDVVSDATYQSTYYPVALNWLKGRSGYLGIPLEVDGLGLFYNTTIFSSAGKVPPTDWNELRKTAYELTVPKSGPIERGGIALGTTNNVEHWADILGVMLLQNGADPAHPNTTLGQAAVTFYTNFTLQDKVWDSTMPPAIYAFATEKVAMMIAPSWRAFDIHDQNPNLRFAIAPIPQLPGTRTDWGTFWVEGVSNRSAKNKQALAWKLLQFMSQKDTLQKLYTAQSQVRLFGEPFPRLDMADQLKSDPYVGAFIQSAPTMKSWYLSSFTHDNGLNDQNIKYYEDAVNSVLGGMPAAKALATAEEGINQVLKKYNVSSP